MSKATLNVFGDVLEVRWTGNVWEAPGTHRTFTSAKAAMRDELRDYLSACGDDVDAEDTSAQIETLLTNIVVD
jgi:hypothetical protein